MSKKANNYNSKRLDGGYITLTDITNLVTEFQEEHGLSVDGMLGPNTLRALRDKYPTVLHHLPRNRREVYEIFGEPPRTSRSKDLVPLRFEHLPYTTHVHRLAAPRFERFFEEAEEKYGYKPQRVWCHLYRHQRHDDSLPLSYHSWGIAMDLDSHYNGAISFKRTRPPKPFSEAWYHYWPNTTITPELVDLAKSCGFSWGGDWRTFKDPMHFELVRR